MDGDDGLGWPILKYVVQWENAVDRTLSDLEARRVERSAPGLTELQETGRRVREARELGEAS